MKDKIAALVTLTAVFSLFLYYKVNPAEQVKTAENYNTINEEELIINLVDEVDLEETEDEDFSNSNLEIDECSLELGETNKLSFSEAFKYYRTCLGNDDVFSWNSNTYKTLLSNEVVEEKSNGETLNLVVQNSGQADKHHLELQNEIFESNSDK